MNKNIPRWIANNRDRKLINMCLITTRLAIIQMQIKRLGKKKIRICIYGPSS